MCGCVGVGPPGVRMALAFGLAWPRWLRRVKWQARVCEAAEGLGRLQGGSTRRHAAAATGRQCEHVEIRRAKAQRARQGRQGRQAGQGNAVQPRRRGRGKQKAPPVTATSTRPASWESRPGRLAWPTGPFLQGGSNSDEGFVPAEAIRPVSGSQLMLPAFELYLRPSPLPLEQGGKSAHMRGRDQQNHHE